MQLVRSPRLRSWVLPLGLGVLIAAIVGGAVWIGRGGSSHPAAAGSNGTPPVLHLTSDSSKSVMAAEEPSQSHPGSSSPYVLVGTLPDGQPDDQAVWRPRPADAKSAADVAAALGLAGTPTRIDGGWVLRSDNSNRLIVRDDGSWSYGLDCAPSEALANEDPSVMCAYATAAGGASTGDTVTTAPVPPDQPDPTASDEPPTAEPVPSEEPGPSESDARAAAAKVFDKLGLGDATVTYYAGVPSAQVQATPTVHGLTATGWSTSLQVTRQGAIASGDGWIVGVDEGDAYPVITAKQAFDLLQQQPRPAIELCVRRPDGKPGCAPVPPTEITGARLGLMLDYDGSSAVLVPAWLFDVKGGSEPLTQIAVDPSFLAPPPQPTDDPGAVEPGSVEPGAVGSGSGSGGSSGSGGGSAPAPGGPVGVAPTKPAPGDSAPADPGPVDTPNTK